jgi:hypothetical protein
MYCTSSTAKCRRIGISRDLLWRDALTQQYAAKLAEIEQQRPLSKHPE